MPPSNTPSPVQRAASRPSAAYYANARRTMFWTAAAIPVVLGLIVFLGGGGMHIYAEKAFRFVTWAMTASVSFIVYGGWLDIKRSGT